VRRQFIIHHTKSCSTPAKETNQRTIWARKEQGYKEQIGLEKNQPTKNNRPKQEGGLSLTPTPAAAAKIRDFRSGAGPS
jgi:hypothetical protein